MKKSVLLIMSFIIFVNCGKEGDNSVGLSSLNPISQKSCGPLSGYAAKVNEGVVELYSLNLKSGKSSLATEVTGARSLWSGKGPVYVARNNSHYLIAADEQVKPKLYKINFQSKEIETPSLLDGIGNPTLAGLGHDLNIYGVGYQGNQAVAFKINIEEDKLEVLGSLGGLANVVNGQVQISCDGEFLYALGETNVGNRIFVFDILQQTARSLPDNLGIETFVASPDEGQVIATKTNGEGKLEIFSSNISNNSMSSQSLGVFEGLDFWIFSSAFDYSTNTFYAIGNAGKLFGFRYQGQENLSPIDVGSNFVLSRN
ncbi:MAG: hypothetical protein H6621_03025 [Halobacteriovoraceae bacterium]|nr:hypothetical protein [Halobacteriovoraceae bacterium]MCB9094018.1 hypothetical protein [Halobacteriovoraceae bacterium]